MNPAVQLLFAQPVVFWLAAGAAVLAGGLATGASALSRAAAAGPLAALAATVLPGAPAAQAAAFALGGLALAAAPFRRRPPPVAPARDAPAVDAPRVDSRLLGRTVRALEFNGSRGLVAVDGARLPATLPPDDPAPAPGARLRVVRVADGELAVRRLQVD